MPALRSLRLACVLLLGCQRAPESSGDSAADTPAVDATPAAPATPMVGPGWCSVDGWCWLEPDPHGNNLHGVHAFAADDAWAVGARGTLVHWDGESWSRVELGVGPDVDLHAVWAAGPERMFVAADDGVILAVDARSLPLGEIERHEPSTRTFRSLWGSSAQDVYALAPSVDYQDGQHDDARLFHYDASTWTQVDANPLATATVVCGAAADDMFVLGDHGQAAHFDGQAWQPLQSPALAWRFGDAHADARGMLAVAHDDHLVEYAQSQWLVGATTHGLPTDIAGEGARLTAVTRSPDGEIWAGSDGGSLLVWKDVRWSATVLREGHAILDLATAGDRVFAVGEAGTALVVPRGEPWAKPVGTRRHAVQAIAGLGEHVWVADEHNLWHYDGARWTTHEIMSRTDTLWPVSPTEVHVIGELGYRRFDGQTMHPAELPHPTFAGQDVWASGSDDVWLAAREYLMHFDGQAWQVETIEIEAWDMHGGDDNLLVAGPRQQPTDAAVWTVARRSGGAWTVELEADEHPLLVHAHGREGGVAIDRQGHGWLRDPSGWHEIETLPKAGVGVWMHDPTHVWAIDEGGTIYRYDGRQWQVEQSDMQMPLAIGASETYLLLGNAQGSVIRRSLASG
jgi:hypothetical protein